MINYQINNHTHVLVLFVYNTSYCNEVRVILVGIGNTLDALSVFSTRMQTLSAHDGTNAVLFVDHHCPCDRRTVLH